MKKHLLLVLGFLICMLSLSGCGLTNLLNGVQIAKETTIYEETESRESTSYDEDDDLSDDDEGDDDNGVDDSQESGKDADVDSTETTEEVKYE